MRDISCNMKTDMLDKYKYIHCTVKHYYTLWALYPIMPKPKYAWYLLQYENWYVPPISIYKYIYCTMSLCRNKLSGICRMCPNEMLLLIRLWRRFLLYMYMSKKLYLSRPAYLSIRSRFFPPLNFPRDVWSAFPAKPSICGKYELLFAHPDG